MCGRSVPPCARGRWRGRRGGELGHSARSLAALLRWRNVEQGRGYWFPWRDLPQHEHGAARPCFALPNPPGSCMWLGGEQCWSSTHPGGQSEAGSSGVFIYHLNIGKLRGALARVPELWDSFPDAMNILSIPSCVKERVCRIGTAAQAKIPLGAGIKE